MYSASERMLPRHPWGSVDTTQLLHLLSQHGLLDARVEDTPRGVVIHLVLLHVSFCHFKSRNNFSFQFCLLAKRGHCDSTGRFQHSCLLPRRSATENFKGYFATMSTLFVNITINTFEFFSH